MTTTPRPVPLAHDLTGSGPLLVLLHGITEDRRSFDPLTDDLARDHTVLRVDLRGHGRSPEADTYDLASMAGDVAALVEQVGDGRVPLVVGHSMGGTVATAYAAAFPTRGVVDVDQSLDLAGLQAQVRELEPLLRSPEHHLAIGAVFEALRGPLPADEVTRIEALRAPKQPVVLGVWAPLLDLTTDELDVLVRQVAAGVQVPYLSLHGTDPGPDYPAWLRERIPTATVEVWDDHGHYPHLVDAPRFLDRLRAFEAELAG
ncbi:alpha/beta hydrolase [Nitriliruptoraceae bacterium ZYF776]|nr:alpha/beta hydrolase [Profundirhabdus halotolerans]